MLGENKVASVAALLFHFNLLSPRDENKQQDTRLKLLLELTTFYDQTNSIFPPAKAPSS
jgi:hypothetical protein